MFKGVYTAIITPFREGRVDEKKLRELLELQIKAGVQGVVPCGTTGESLFLSFEEQKLIIEICKSVCSGCIKVIPGTGGPSTQDTIQLTQQAEKVGADGVVIITPWYVKPSQESLVQHYKQVDEVTNLPFIIYNNPTRTGVDISFETLVKLASCKNLKGYKESGTHLPRISQLRERLSDRLSLLAGNDDLLAAHLGMGADGGILVASNVIPEFFTKLVNAWSQGNISLFQEIWNEIFPLLYALSLESNPAPIKYAMHLIHGVSLETRLPFVPLQDSTKKAIESALVDLGLWKPLASVRER